jgi:hypothetical protein
LISYQLYLPSLLDVFQYLTKASCSVLLHICFPSNCSFNSSLVHYSDS